MAPSKEITRLQEKAVIEHRTIGLPNKDIAEQLGLSESACSKIWKAYLQKDLGIKRLEIAAKASNKVEKALDHVDAENPEHWPFLSKVWKDALPEEPKTEVNTTVNVGIALFNKEDAPKAEEMFRGRIIEEEPDVDGNHDD